MLNTKRRWAMGLTLAVAVLAGCGTQVRSTFQVIHDGESTNPGEQTAWPSREPVTVTLVDSSFGPDISVPPGTMVTFVNDGGLKHTASHGTYGQLAEDSLFDFVLEPGDSASYTFDAPGTYLITCIVHPTMNGTITVE